MRGWNQVLTTDGHVYKLPAAAQVKYLDQQQLVPAAVWESADHDGSIWESAVPLRSVLLLRRCLLPAPDVLGRQELDAVA